ncbi:MAG: RNA-binding protein, partial [Sphingobacteriaceae bacterium]
DKDGRKDLVLCGEMMPVKVYRNTKTGFIDQTENYFDKPANGMWFSINFADVNGDGNPDLIAGNLGLNTVIRASEKEPAELIYADFDGNGSIDPFLNFYVQGVNYPFVSRDELNEQIYPMRKKFNSYRAYSDVGMKDIFTEDQLQKAGKLTVNRLQTTVFLNQNGKFTPMDLPAEANFAPITQILSKDFNHDGKTDLLLLGNHSDNRLKLGSMDANYGCFLSGNGNREFEYKNQSISGLSVTGDVKSALEINIKNVNYLLIGISGQPLQFYKMP